jgi:hypothetical protein
LLALVDGSCLRLHPLLDPGATTAYKCSLLGAVRLGIHAHDRPLSLIVPAFTCGRVIAHEDRVMLRSAGAWHALGAEFAVRCVLARLGDDDDETFVA